MNIEFNLLRLFWFIGISVGFIFFLRLYLCHNIPRQTQVIPIPIPIPIPL